MNTHHVSTGPNGWRIAGSSQARGRRALTLLELLVVLVILAVVATVAVSSLEPRLENARYEQTKKELNNIGDAIIGNRFDRQSDGTPMISGFVADIGRLPAVESFEEGQELNQLWESNGRLAFQFPFQFRSGPAEPVDLRDVQLPCGWRGPYLQLGLGDNQLLDAWSRPFRYVLSLEQNVQTIVWDPVEPYDEELKLDLQSGFVTVTGTLTSNSEIPANTRVYLLAPDPAQSVTELRLFEDEDQGENTFTFSGVPVGLRAICVTQNDSKVVRYVQVPHRGLTLNIDLAAK